MIKIREKFLLTIFTFGFFCFLAAGSSGDEKSIANKSEIANPCTFGLSSMVLYAESLFNQNSHDIKSYEFKALSMGNGGKIKRDGLKDEVVDSGQADFKGRSIPACLLKSNVTWLNVHEGTKKEVCYAMAYISDKEFDVYRSIELMECSEISGKLPKWIKENNVTGMKLNNSSNVSAPIANGNSEAVVTPVSNEKYAVSDEVMSLALKNIISPNDRINYIFHAIQSARLPLSETTIDFNFPSKGQLSDNIAELLESNEQWWREDGGPIYLAVYNPTNVTISKLGIDLYNDGSCGSKGASIYKSFVMTLPTPLYPTKFNAYKFNTKFDKDNFAVNSSACLIISKAWQ
jgi:hypothetical protein